MTYGNKFYSHFMILTLSAHNRIAGPIGIQFRINKCYRGLFVYVSYNLCLINI